MAKWDPLRKTKRDFIIYRFWVKHQDDMTQKEIGEHFHTSRQNINRIVNTVKCQIEAKIKTSALQRFV